MNYIPHFVDYKVHMKTKTKVVGVKIRVVTKQSENFKHCYKNVWHNSLKSFPNVLNLWNPQQPWGGSQPVYAPQGRSTIQHGTIALHDTTILFSTVETSWIADYLQHSDSLITYGSCYLEFGL